MQSFLVDLLQCPACEGELAWQIEGRRGEQIEQARARCRDCEAVYPVREGIGIFLTDDLPREDLWEGALNGLVAYLDQNPILARRLMETPLAELNPADRFFRATLLEARGEFARAEAVRQQAEQGLYTPEYRRCYSRQLDYLVETLTGGQGPVVDLASGMGQLVERLADRLARPIVATDFSLPVLRRNRLWLAEKRWTEKVSLLACDARRTPFKDRSLPLLTTNLGLANIREPGTVLSELRRVVEGCFLAVAHFYPPDDFANRPVIEQLGAGRLLYRAQAEAAFAAAGWELETAEVCTGWAAPTPGSQILAGAGIDSLPVAETELEWMTLIAR